MSSDIFKKLQQQFLSDLPAWKAQKRMAPPLRTGSPSIPKMARRSAVCTLLFYKNNELNTLLIKRTEDGKTHGGQISFPGGRLDDNDFSLTYCALRECEEEIGLPKNNIKVLGKMSQLYIPPSNFLVSPIVGFVDNLENLIPSPTEVQEIIKIPINNLFHDSNKITKEVYRRNDKSLSVKTPVYQYQEHIIWGATAMMLAEFEEIYRRVQ